MNQGHAFKEWDELFGLCGQINDEMKIVVGNIVDAFNPAISEIRKRCNYAQSLCLEREGRLCRDKRRRNRYFRKAKRLRMEG